MNKEEILADVMSIHNRNIILEISTGGGKSLCALKQIEKILSESNRQEKKVLIVIPKLALIKNWLKEINTSPDLAKFCKTAYFQNSMMFLAYHYIFINNVSNPSNYHGGGSYGGLGGSSGVGSW